MAGQGAAMPLRRIRANGSPSARPAKLSAATSAQKAKRPVRVPEVMLGVLLVAGCALAAVLWNQSNTATSTIVVAARHIARGTAITADDLRGAEMSGATSVMVGGADARLLLGQFALVDIDANSPFTDSLLTASSPLGVDEALTSMALEPGQLPPDLAANDDVRLVVTSVPDATGVSTTQLLDDDATVWSVVDAPDGMSSIVTVRGPITLSSAVASASKVQLARVEGR